MSKTIFITGGSRGIGEATVRAAAGKYNVIFTYFTGEERARELEGELNARFGGVAAIKCDVGDVASVKEAARQAIARFKHIDVLVNNAGISMSKLLLDTSVEDWERVFKVNTKGVFNVTKEFLPELIARKGSVVNISSVWGSTGASMEVAYSASKSAVNGFTRALAKELAPMGVRVNAVAPGAIDTDMMKEYSVEDVERLISDKILLGRLGSAKEVADAILFVAESEYISGAVLPVDGLLS